MPNIDELEKDLKEYLQSLLDKFVNPHIPAKPESKPADYELDVRAFCVLSHAAFEHFVEQTVLQVAGESIERWVYKRTVSEALISLLTWKGRALKIDEDERNPERSVYEYLRELIELAKSEFSKAVNDNHGISIGYLRCLTIPVAIDVKQDANLINSLNKLAEGRGEYAHKGRTKSTFPPEDAKKYASDVMSLCEDIRQKAQAKLA